MQIAVDLYILMGGFILTKVSAILEFKLKFSRPTPYLNH